MNTDLSPSRKANGLLRNVSTSEFDRLAPHLELVQFGAKQVLLGEKRDKHIYFPVSGLLARFVRMSDGSMVEAGMVGSEGAIPLCLFLGVDDTPFRVFVLIPGRAFRLELAVFRRLVRPGSLLHGILLRYTAFIFSQSSYTSACNRLHSLEQRYCRWLLMMHDRAKTRDFHVKQETIAEMLGVRRVSISAMARKLEAEGLLACGRGKLNIVDPDGLRVRACECYELIKAAEQLLSSPLPNEVPPA